MRSNISSDKFRRFVVQKRQVSRKLLRLQGYLESAVFVNVSVFRYRPYWALSGYGCAVKIRNRCFFSGRGRGISIFGLSRHVLRSILRIGFVNGLFRATW